MVLKTGSNFEIFLVLSVIVAFFLSLFLPMPIIGFFVSTLWAGVVGGIFIMKDKF